MGRRRRHAGRTVAVALVGKTLSQVACVPATAVRLSTAAPALPSVGILAGDPLTPVGRPVNVHLEHLPRTDPVVGAVPEVAAVRRLAWHGCRRRAAGRSHGTPPPGCSMPGGTKYPSTSTTTLTVPGRCKMLTSRWLSDVPVWPSATVTRLATSTWAPKLKVRGQRSVRSRWIDGEQARRQAVDGEQLSTTAVAFCGDRLAGARVRVSGDLEGERLGPPPARHRCGSHRARSAVSRIRNGVTGTKLPSPV